MKRSRREHKRKAITSFFGRWIGRGISLAFLIALVAAGVWIVKHHGVAMLILGACGIPALIGGIFMLDTTLKANIVYWGVVGTIGWLGYSLITKSPGWMSYLFVGVIALIVIGLIVSIIDYLIKGKYK